MKTSKYLSILLASVFLLTTPGVAVAQQSSGVQQDFCQRVESLSSNTLSSMQAKRQIAVKINTNSVMPSQKLSQARTEADKIRAKHFSVIIAKLKDPAHKQAVASYQDSLTQAISVRRNSTDSIQNNFSENLNKLVIRHQDSVAASEDSMMSEVRQSFDGAKLSCVNDPNNQLIRSQLSSNLRNAKANFAIQKQNLAQNGLEYQRLVQARNLALSNAVEEFKRSELRARQDLLSVIKLDR